MPSQSFRGGGFEKEDFSTIQAAHRAEVFYIAQLGNNSVYGRVERLKEGYGEVERFGLDPVDGGAHYGGKKLRRNS